MWEFENGKTLPSRYEFRSTKELSKSGPSRDIKKLATQVHLLCERLTKLEESVQQLSFSMSLSGKGTNTSNEVQNKKWNFDTSGAIKAAVAVIDRNLITSQPRSRNIFQQVGDVFLVLKRYNFAILQCLLMFLAIALVLVFGVVQFYRAKSSVNETYKPFKIEGIDHYDAHENLIYEFPLHYFWFEFNYEGSYNETFNEDCDSWSKTCLERQWEKAFKMALAPICVNSELSDDGYLNSEYGFLRNLTVYVDEQPSTTEWFWVLVRLEFKEFELQMPGTIYCISQLDLDTFTESVSNFGSLSTDYIWFTISREEFNSGLTVYTERKKLISLPGSLETLNYGYYFEENTFDGKSEITADMYLISQDQSVTNQIIIRVYAPPFVKNFVSYYRYSYLHWLADLGGFFTVVTSFFLILTNRVTKFANRNDNFHLKQGILPSFSLKHRNAEEIAGLRSITMAGLGITEEEYFFAQHRASHCNMAKRVVYEDQETLYPYHLLESS